MASTSSPSFLVSSTTPEQSTSSSSSVSSTHTQNDHTSLTIHNTLTTANEFTKSDNNDETDTKNNSRNNQQYPQSPSSQYTGNPMDNSPRHVDPPAASVTSYGNNSRVQPYDLENGKPNGTVKAPSSFERNLTKKNSNYADESNAHTNGDGATTLRSKSPLGSTKKSKARKCLSTCYAYTCCCIPKNRTTRIICCSITWLILIGLVIFGVIYWPRFPGTNVLELKFDNEAGAFRFELPAGSSNWNELSLTVNLKMNISASNDNVYPLKIENIELKVGKKRC
jgi:hypothetical protein